MAKIKITQVKSGIDRSKRQKKTVRALGITKLHTPGINIIAWAKMMGITPAAFTFKGMY